MRQDINKGKKSNLIPRLLMISSAGFWGASFIFTKGLFLTEEAITPVVIVTFRLLIASVFTIPTLMVWKRLQRLDLKDLPMFLVLAFFEPFIYSILETSGVSLVSSSLASIIIATIPLFTPFGIALVYKEKLPWVAIVGAVLSMMGIVVMMLGPDLSFEANPRGVFYLAMCVVVAVCYTLVLVKVLDKYPPLTITAYQNLLSLLYFIPLVLIINRDVFPLLSYSWPMFGRLIFLGVFCSTVAYMGFNVGIKHLGATSASVYNNLIPVFTLVLAVLIGQESLSLMKVLGMAVVLVGLFLAQKRK